MRKNSKPRTFPSRPPRINKHLESRGKVRGEERKLEILSQGLEDLVDYAKSLWRFLPIAICSVGPQGSILDVNKSFEDFSLWPILEIVGKPLTFVFSQTEASEIINQTLEKRNLSARETDLLTKKGEKIAVAVYSHVREDREGNIIGFFLALVDIRESKKFRETLERRVDERTRELQEKVEELEKINRLTVGRELKMIELKEELGKAQEEIKKLKEPKVKKYDQ